MRLWRRSSQSNCPISFIYVWIQFRCICDLSRFFVSFTICLERKLVIGVRAVHFTMARINTACTVDCAVCGVDMHFLPIWNCVHVILMSTICLLFYSQPQNESQRTNRNGHSCTLQYQSMLRSNHHYYYFQFPLESLAKRKKTIRLKN